MNLLFFYLICASKLRYVAFDVIGYKCEFYSSSMPSMKMFSGESASSI